MSDKVYKNKDIEVLVHTIMYNCFQSVEIKESGAALVITITSLNR